MEFFFRNFSTVSYFWYIDWTVARTCCPRRCPSAFRHRGGRKRPLVRPAPAPLLLVREAGFEPMKPTLCRGGAGRPPMSVSLRTSPRSAGCMLVVAARWARGPRLGSQRRLAPAGPASGSSSAVHHSSWNPLLFYEHLPTSARGRPAPHLAPRGPPGTPSPGARTRSAQGPSRRCQAPHLPIFMVNRHGKETGQGRGWVQCAVAFSIAPRW